MRDSGLRVAVIAGVISTMIFALVIQPGLRWGWDIAQPIIAEISSSFTDAIYRSASLGFRSWLDVIIYTAGRGALVGAYAGVLTVLIVRRGRIVGLSDKIKGSRSLIWWLRLLVIVYLSLGIVSSIWAVWRAYADLELNASFRQRATVLAPYISDQTEEELEALWASMSSRSDYESINAKLGELAELNGVALPELLLK